MNPYNDLLDIMKVSTNGEPPFYIGKVISGLPGLTVKTGDIILDKDNL